jgi:hypothetical protein
VFGRIRVLLGLAALTVAASAPCSATKPAPGEKIISFVTDITLREDTSVEVREEFVVRSEETYYKWGMIRHLPISSTERWDQRFAGPWRDDTGIRVKILEVTEDGQSVSYDHGNGAGYGQLEIGKFNVPVPRGDHRFVIRYLAEGVPRLLADQDELYWNVLGHYFYVPVEEAIVRVHLPAGVRSEDIQSEAYVGTRGRSSPLGPDPDLTAEEKSLGTVVYRARSLAPAESVSVVVNWPKGFVTAPKMGILSRDRWLLAAPVVLFLYYLMVWIKVGPEPVLGSVPVRYEPPEGLSPAAVRYIRTTGTDARTLAAVIAQLAARGLIGIELRAGAYKLTQLNADANVLNSLAPEEARVLEMLFDEGKEIVLHPNDGNALNKYSLAVQGQLQKRLDGQYFTRHLGYILPGILASLVAAMWMAVTANGKDTSGALFLTWWFFFCGLILGGILLTSIIPASKLALRRMGGTRQLLIGLGVFLAFGAGFVLVLKQLSQGISPAYTVMLVSLVVIDVGWIPALKRMTPRGRQAVAQIEGFRTFLIKVEQDRMQRLNSTQDAPQVSKDFLAYAIALEVRESWGDRLAEAFFATTTSR